MEFVEVEPNGAVVQLRIYFVREIDDELLKLLTPRSVRIDDGEHPSALKVTGVARATEGRDQLLLTLERAGGNQTYTLRVLDPQTQLPPKWLDPWLAAADFTFVTNRSVETDVVCPHPPHPRVNSEPGSNYLARDYKTFLHLIYDRLAVTLPDWNPRGAPDLMVTLVELFAYVGDYLSYYQDDVATEAYLGTARRRVSVRRHARLVDYRMHEGCNSRVWVCLTVDQDIEFRYKIRFVAGVGADYAPLLMSPNQLDAQIVSATIFESMGALPIRLRAQRNRFEFYTGGGLLAELPAGRTSAMLLNSAPPGPPPLAPGDVIVLEWGGGASHAARLIRVSGAQTDPVTAESFFEVEWSASDALPSPVPLASALVRGNVILADRGMTQSREIAPEFDPVSPMDNSIHLSNTPLAFAAPFPDPSAARRFASRLLRSLVEPLVDDPTTQQDLGRIARKDLARRRKLLRRSLAARARQGGHISAAWVELLREQFAAKGDDAVIAAIENPLGSASSATRFSPAEALPQVVLYEADSGAQWHARADLLDSGPDDRHFVVEVDDDGISWLRFGDGEMGAVPPADRQFRAEYRVRGDSTQLRARQLTTVVAHPSETILASSITAIWNPSAAFGERAPESVEYVKKLAPGAFLNQRERAVVAPDYAELAREVVGVADAWASSSIQGGFEHVRVAILPGPIFATAQMRDDLIEEVADRLAAFRRLGHQLSVVAARRVSLELEMVLDIQPDRRRAEVERDVLEALSSRRLADGGMGFFHPQNLSLGQTISTSKLTARIQAVPGVRAVTIRRFGRVGESIAGAIPPPFLKFHADEIPQLNNDPHHPEQGTIVITTGGRE